MRFIAEDPIKRTITFETKTGLRVRLDTDMVRRYGLEAIMKEYGVKMSKERVLVHQHGRVVGDVPPEFHPSLINSKSFFYDVRPGDFTQRNDGDWDACRTLGPGDLEAIPGFRWKR